MNRESENDEEHLSQENQITWDKNLKKLGEAGVRAWMEEHRSCNDNLEDPIYSVWQAISGALTHIEYMQTKFNVGFDWDVTPRNLAEKAKAAFDAAVKNADLES